MTNRAGSRTLRFQAGAINPSVARGDNDREREDESGFRSKSDGFRRRFSDGENLGIARRGEGVKVSKVVRKTERFVRRGLESAFLRSSRRSGKRNVALTSSGFGRDILKIF